jgi:glycosyltransferase involved in cell wall biosynthesis
MGKLNERPESDRREPGKVILYIYDGDWPLRATRVGKQTRSLARGGHLVHLISRNDLRQPRTERTGWMTVRRLPSVRNAWLNRLINLPFFFNPVWFYCIWRAARDAHADYILVRDLPLALTAVWVGKLLRKPVVYDMAEVYPEFLRDRFLFERTSWTDYVVKNPRVADIIERAILKRADKIIVVSEESWLRCRRFGVDEKRLVLVGNTPDDFEAISAPQQMPACFTPFRDSPKLLFVGILLWDRGVGEAVRAMPAILKAHPNAMLVIAGDGSERPRIEQAIAEAGVERNVVLLGWQDHKTLPPLYAYSDIGLLPFLPGNHVKITLANKLFDYMAARLPIVASDLPPMRRILEETKAGTLFEPGDSGALAQVVIDLLGDPSRRRALGENGHRAAASKYRWSEDERRLLEAFRDPPHNDVIPAVLPASYMRVQSLQ